MSCTCWYEVSAKLAAEGLAISDTCTAMRVVNLTLSAHLGFPLRAKDGKKLKRGQPTFLFLSFCPFCGESLKRKAPEDPKAPAESEVAK